SGHHAEQISYRDRRLEAHEQVERIAAAEIDERSAPAGQEEADEAAGYHGVTASKIERDMGIDWMLERLAQRFLKRRRPHAEGRRPVDHLERFRDHQGLKLTRGERRVLVDERVGPQQEPEQAVWDEDDAR